MTKYWVIHYYSVFLFLLFLKYCGIKEIYELTDQLIEHSFLSKELKKQYRLMYKSRVGSYLSVIE